MSEERICPNCGYKGKQKLYTKGTIALEIVLWLFFLLPGLIYSIWRLSSRYRGCPKCGAPNMLPLDSPLGQKLIHGFYPAPQPAESDQPSEPEIDLPPRDESGRFIIPE